MADKILKTRIKLRYDTLTSWEAQKTKVLLAGEVAVVAVPSAPTKEVNSVAAPQILFKVGDGTTTFENLPWTSGMAADVYDWAKEETINFEDSNTLVIPADSSTPLWGEKGRDFRDGKLWLRNVLSPASLVGADYSTVGEYVLAKRPIIVEVYPDGIKYFYYPFAWGTQTISYTDGGNILGAPRDQWPLQLTWGPSTSGIALKGDDNILVKRSEGWDIDTWNVSHAEKGPAAGYTSNNTTISISGSGSTGTIKIPQLTVDKYGHVNAAADEDVTITLPTIPAVPDISVTNGTATTPTTDSVEVVTSLSNSGTKGHDLLTTRVDMPTKAYIDKVVAGAVQYWGVAHSLTDLGKDLLSEGNPDISATKLGAGDFYRAGQDIKVLGVIWAHTGDLLIRNSKIWKDGSDNLKIQFFDLVIQENYQGTVTSITAGTGLSGGTITSSGTIAVKDYGTLLTSKNAPGNLVDMDNNPIVLDGGASDTW